MLWKPSEAEQRVTAERRICTHTPFIWTNTLRRKREERYEVRVRGVIEAGSCPAHCLLVGSRGKPHRCLTDVDTVATLGI
ncbi:hypothetical protein SRHO_G00052340 [Serrasalmus rhombeus]